MRLVLISFALMGVAFYELSGGADFEPRQRVVEANPSPFMSAEAATTQPESQEVIRVSTSGSATGAAANDFEAMVIKASATTAPAARDAAQTESHLYAQPVALLPAVKPGSEPADYKPEDIRKVTGSRVNMRNGPGTDYSVLAKLTRGDEVEVLDVLDNGWVKLRTKDAKRVGYMADFLLSNPTG